MDVKKILQMHHLTADQLADIVNQAGGRDPHKPIIFSITCQNDKCKEVFFSNTQDHRMRSSQGYSHLCPRCRIEVRRENKQKYARNRKKR
ncbi:hypothetical protein [Ammoniphilus resinae]|uniref:Uncharacterized protein n=1 Tax=Ammoniphilus resinae TaxID=861532 RepID=A0ABS4GNM9_9BACL|nr:hypothetical protein [Ammoniphilus resinae]MBP1931880.1 hypothetical protein [Ammoniphilus resinae]